MSHIVEGVKRLVKTLRLTRPEPAGRLDESPTDSLFNFNVDILSTLKSLISRPRPAPRYPAAHRLPYIFHMGAIFKTWNFQLYEKLKRTTGRRE